MPAEGLVFRTLDGRAIARLSRDEAGGVFELLNGNEEPTMRFSASQAIEAPRTGPRLSESQRLSEAPPLLGREDPFGDRF